VKKVKLYLAGGLFNAGERLHNLYLEKHLRALGYETILPQREALKFFKDGKFNVFGIVRDCQQSCMASKNLYVGSADGADADSGGAIEYGIAVTSTYAAVVYRTDFRTAEDRELGLNAMFQVEGTCFVYRPCFFTELGEVDVYYQELAQAIHDAVSLAQEKRKAFS
jgi:nucleoside 2-deoxyribosyltransferase